MCVFFVCFIASIATSANNRWRTLRRFTGRNIRKKVLNVASQSVKTKVRPVNLLQRHRMLNNRLERLFHSQAKRSKAADRLDQIIIIKFYHNNNMNIISFGRRFRLIKINFSSVGFFFSHSRHLPFAAAENKSGPSPVKVNTLCHFLEYTMRKKKKID